MKRPIDRAFAPVPTFCIVGLLLAVACEDTDTKGWLVDRPRVLGARVEARADPSRAAIAPGEPLRITWLVAAPNGTGRSSWAYAVCPPVTGNFPEPRCERPTLAAGAGVSEGELVTMDLDAPSAAAVADLRELQVLAAFCEAGDPDLDEARFEATCTGGVPALLAAGTVRLAAAGANANPEIAADAVLFDGAPMTPAAARAGAPCDDDASSPVVVAGTKHAFVVRFRGDEREAVPGAPAGLEGIVASHVVTAGELERQYSTLEPTEPAPKDVTMEWTAPAPDEVVAGGRLVEMYLVLRDGRGGTAFARRTVCVRR